MSATFSVFIPPTQHWCGGNTNIEKQFFVQMLHRIALQQQCLHSKKSSTKIWLQKSKE
jgi:hypothetical protein